jgi:hypothetical protein
VVFEMKLDSWQTDCELTLERGLLIAVTEVVDMPCDTKLASSLSPSSDVLVRSWPMGGILSTDKAEGARSHIIPKGLANILLRHTCS